MSGDPGKTGKGRGLKRLLIVLAALLIVLLIAVAVYAGDFSRADAVAAEAMQGARAQRGMYAFGSESAETGLILYPGGKVEHTAYAPLTKRIAETADILVVVPKMPMQLAVLDMDAAEDVMEQYPGVTRWYVGGHSLGGAMAASFAAAYPNAVAGVVLLAAYASKPVPVPTLSVYGESDTVLNREKYEAGRAFLPAGYKEVAVAGGNHARFGNYGVQKGDSAAAITADEQQSVTAAAIADWLAAQADEGSAAA